MLNIYALFLSLNLYANVEQIGASLEKYVLEKEVGTNCVANAFVALSILGHTQRFHYSYLDPEENAIKILPVETGMMAVERIMLLLPDANVQNPDQNLIELRHMTHSFLVLHDNEKVILCDAFEDIHDFRCRNSSRIEIEQLNQAVKNYVREQKESTHQDLMSFFLNDLELKHFNWVASLKPYPVETYESLKATSEEAVKFFRGLIKTHPSWIGDFFLYLEKNGSPDSEIELQSSYARLAGASLIDRVRIEILKADLW